MGCGGCSHTGIGLSLDMSLGSRLVRRARYGAPAFMVAATVAKRRGTRTMRRQIVLLYALLVAAFAFTACSGTFDAYFLNACSQDVRVVTYAAPPGTARESEDHRYKEFSLPGRSVTRIQEAFTDAGGYEWSFRVDAGDFVVVDGRDWDVPTLLITAEMCSE